MPAHFHPFLVDAAKALGTSPTNLWYALTGRTSSPRLVNGYFDFAIPRILARLPLPALPVGARIVVPGGPAGSILAGALKDFGREEAGGELVITAPLRVAPWPLIEPPSRGPATPRKTGSQRKSSHGKSGIRTGK